MAKPLLTSLFLAAVARTDEDPPNDEMLLGVTVKIFTMPSENDTVSWQEDTDGKIILCYRDGRIYFGWLEDWQPYATRTAQSSSAHMTKTWSEGSYTEAPSYTLNWRDLPANVLARAEFANRNNEEVWQGLDDVWNKRPRMTSGAGGLLLIEHF